MEKLCIQPKEVMVLTGKSERQARNILKKTKEHYKKLPHQFVTIEEFCLYAGLDHANVRKMLR